MTPTEMISQFSKMIWEMAWQYHRNTDARIDVKDLYSEALFRIALAGTKRGRIKKVLNVSWYMNAARWAMIEVIRREAKQDRIKVKAVRVMNEDIVDYCFDISTRMDVGRAIDRLVVGDSQRIQDRNRLMFRQHYLAGYPIMEVARRANVSRQIASQVMRESRRQMRLYLCGDA